MFLFSGMAIIRGYRPAKFPWATERSTNANIWSATRFKLVIRAAVFSRANPLKDFGNKREGGERFKRRFLVNSIRRVKKSVDY